MKKEILVCVRLVDHAYFPIAERRKRPRNCLLHRFFRLWHSMVDSGYGYIQIKFMNHYRFQDDGYTKPRYFARINCEIPVVDDANLTLLRPLATYTNTFQVVKLFVVAIFHSDGVFNPPIRHLNRETEHAAHVTHTHKHTRPEHCIRC